MIYHRVGRAMSRTGQDLEGDDIRYTVYLVIYSVLFEIL